jgi:hypothetical protein
MTNNLKGGKIHLAQDFSLWSLDSVFLVLWRGSSLWQRGMVEENCSLNDIQEKERKTGRGQGQYYH